MKQTSLQNIKDSVSGDIKISIAIMSSFAILTIQYLILTYFNLLGTGFAGKVRMLSKIIVGFLYILAFPTVIKRNKNMFFWGYTISFIIFLLNYIFFIENRIYLKNIIFPYFFICLPSLIYSYSINDWTTLKSIMKKTSIIVFIAGSIIGIMVFTKVISIGRYSMPLSYYMLLPSVVYINEFLDSFNIKSIFIALVSLLIILALGSRGPIMCVGVFVILKVINIRKKINYKVLSIFFIIIAFIFIGIFYFNVILENLYNLLLEFGIRSRSIELFLTDDIYLSGRENIYGDVIQGIKSNLIFGIGLLGDRTVTGGRYTHNIIIEIVANFGIIIGGVLVLLLVIVSCKTLFSKNKKLSSFIAMWFSIGVVHLMVSSTYLTDYKFWIYLGLALKATKNNHERIMKYEDII